MKIAVISFTKNGSRCNAGILRRLNAKGHYCDGYAAGTCAAGDALHPLTTPLKKWTEDAFKQYEALIFVGAAGIAVRSIAPYVQDKFKDPAVLVVDEKGQFVIPILSGHVGGANGLALELSEELGACPVLTTATDVQNRFAVDVFAVKNRLILTDRKKAKRVSADLLNGVSLGVYIDEIYCAPQTYVSGNAMSDGVSVESPDQLPCEMPEGLYRVQRPENSRIMIDYHRMNEDLAALHLIPKDALWIGIGCKKGTDGQAIEAAFEQLMEKHHLCVEAVAGIASIELKAEEPGILQLCRRHGWRFQTFSADELMAVPGNFTASDFVRQHTGVENVCERAAVCAAGDGSTLIISKQKWPGITLAAAIVNRRLDFG